MPISKYFKGKGEEVMSSMRKQYGPKRAKDVFYATAQKKMKKAAKNAKKTAA